MSEQGTSQLPLRVAIFSDAIPERNGAGAYYSDLAGQLEVRLEQVQRFEPVMKPRMRFTLPLPGDRTQKLLTPNVPRLWKQFKELRPDVVVVVTPGPFGLLGIFLARKYKTGLLSAFHTHFEELARMYFNPVSFWVMNKYLVGVNRRLIRRSGTVLINNRNLEPTVRKLGARRVDVVGTPLAPAFRADTGIQPSGKLDTVLFAGRLAPEKNLPSVLEAARQLPEITFLIAGDGPLGDWLKAQADGLSNVNLLGWLKRPELLQAMEQADLLLLPSKMETFGTVALEAMARCRPAMVAEGAGIHDWPELAGGLITLPEGKPAGDLLRELQSESREAWVERGLAAQQAAFRLNDHTIEQWLGIIQEHAGIALSA